MQIVWFLNHISIKLLKIKSNTKMGFIWNFLTPQLQHFEKFFGGIFMFLSPFLINERVYGDHCLKLNFCNKNQYR